MNPVATRWLLLVSGTLVVGGAGVMAWAPGSTPGVLLGLGLATLGCGLGGWRLRRRDDRQALWWIGGVAVVARAVLVPAGPVLEDDLNRYLWDGRVLAGGVSPYRFSPQQVYDRRLDRPIELRGDDADAVDRLAAWSRTPAIEPAYLGINYPSVPTIYPPGAQYVFAAAAAIRPGSVATLKLIFVGADLLTALACVALLRARGRPTGLLVWYAWSPLVLVSFAGSAHLDALAMAALMAALVAVARGWPARAGALLGLAVSFKLFALVVAPVLLWRLGRRGVGALAVALGLLFAPFATEPRLLEGVAVFARLWRFNEAGFTGVSALAGDDHARRVVGVGVAMLALVLAVRARRDPLPVRPALQVLTALVVMAPVVNPWYVAWLVPLAVVERSIPVLVLSCTVLGYYALPLAATDGWIRLLEFGPPLVFLKWPSILAQQSSKMENDSKMERNHANTCI